jgi:choline kinase
MKAIILAAGQGTRLKKYTENLPKGMLEFSGKTLIERQIDVYHSCGIDEIIVVKGFAGDKINYENVQYVTNTKFATTNMVVSFLCAKDYFDESVIVSYSDIIFEKEMLLKLIQNNHDISVVVDDNWKEYWKLRYGYIDFDTESLEIDHNDNIISLGKENPELEDISSRYVGLIKFSQSSLREIVRIYNRDKAMFQQTPWGQSGKNIENAYMTDLLQVLINEGFNVKAVRHINGWLEFDTNEDYEKTVGWLNDSKHFFLTNILKN